MSVIGICIGKIGQV